MGRKQRATPKPAELIEANKAELLKQFENMDIMEWYTKEYKGATTK